LAREPEVADLACDPSASQENDEPPGAVLTMMRRLETEFAPREVDNLLTAVRAGQCSHSAYANAVGLSLRGFEYRLSKLRAGIQV